MGTALEEFEFRLREALPAYGVEPEAGRIARLARFLGLLTDWNGRVRLVGSTGVEVLVRRHVGESLALIPMLERSGLHWQGRALVDIGSGAGFPGLALQVAFPELKVTLIEGQGKKARFLQAMVDEFGAGRVIAGRSEEQKGLTGDLVTARALERMEVVAPKLLRNVRSGGRLCLWVNGAQVVQWRQRGVGRVEAELLPGSEDRWLAVIEEEHGEHRRLRGGRSLA